MLDAELGNETSMPALSANGTKRVADPGDDGDEHAKAARRTSFDAHEGDARVIETPHDARMGGSAAAQDMVGHGRSEEVKATSSSKGAAASKAAIDVELEYDDDDDDVDLSNYQLEEEKVDVAPVDAPRPASGRVLVSNLAFETTTESIEKLFEGCGTIVRIDTPFVNRFERTAHVTFTTQDDALRAVQKTGSKLDGRRLVVLLEPEVGALASQGPSSDDQLATYGYKAAGRGNRYYGTVFADDDARSREKLRKREERRSGHVGLGQPTGFPNFL